MSEAKKPTMVKGEDLNFTLLQAIRNRRKALLNDGKAATTTGTDTAVYEIDKAKGLFIQQSDKDEYDCLNEIENIFLIFKNKDNGEEDLCSDHDLYDIPGVKLVVDGKEKEVPICIRIDKIRDLAKKAQEYEKILGRSISIKFPNQVHQFRFGDAKVPGEKYEPMRPKFASESAEEYEQAIRSYYLIQGKKAEPTEDKLYRKPFPHELTDYKGDKPVRKEENQSEYYSYRLRKIKHDKVIADKGKAKGKKPSSGKHRITKAELYDYDKPSVFENIKDLIGSIPAALKDEGIRRKIKYATISTLAVGAGVYVAVAAHMIPILLAPASVVGIWAWKKSRDLKKAKEEAIKKIEEEGIPGEDTPTDVPTDTPEPTVEPPKKDPKKPGEPTGPTRTSAGTPPKGDSGSGTSGNPVPPKTPPKKDPEPKPVMVNLGEGLEEIIASLRANNRQIKSCDSKILLLKDELANLDPSAINYESKKASLEEELSKVIKLQRQVLENLKGDVNDILASYHLDDEIGGPKL